MPGCDENSGELNIAEGKISQLNTIVTSDLYDDYLKKSEEQIEAIQD